MLGQSMEVVVMAANARFLDVREETGPTVYLPFDPERFLPGQIHIAILRDSFMDDPDRIARSATFSSTSTDAGLRARIFIKFRRENT